MDDDIIQIFIDKNITNNFNYFLYAFIFYLPLIFLVAKICIKIVY